MISTKGAKRLLLCAGFLALSMPAAFADLFNVAIDTSSLSGTTGGIYMLFTTPMNAASTTVTITGFTISGPGSVLDSTPAGGVPMGIVSPGAVVTGALDAPPLVFTDAAQADDFLQYLNFGTSLSFHVSFDSPVQNGSLFDFGLTASDGISPLLSTNPAGFIGEIAVSDTGAFSTTAFNSAATINSIVTPEPNTFSVFLMAAGILLLTSRKARRKRV